MVAIFYKSRRIPILLPLFIAITALSCMIILQGKGSDPQNLIYEAGAVLLLAIACFIVTHKNASRAEDFDFNNKKIKESEYLSDITKYLKVSVKRIA